MTDNLFLDTYALVELVSGSEKGRRVRNLIKKHENVYCSPLNLYELWYLTALSKNTRTAESVLISVKSLANLLPVSEDVCILAAKLRTERFGKKIGAIDYLTAASAILSQCVVVTGDKHFLEFKELRVELL